MGSLKDETRGLQPGEKSDDAGSRTLEGGSQGSELLSNSAESNILSEDDTISESIDDDSRGKDCNPTEPVSKIQETEANNNQPPKDEDVPNNNIVQLEKVTVSQATDPFSPAPFGQHHMRTQVSLEVVQCCSAATSPMTPPEGDHTFFFPNTTAIATDTEELDTRQTAQFCSVATSPMTPKPTVFPEVQSMRGGEKQERTVVDPTPNQEDPSDPGSDTQLKAPLDVSDTNRQRRMGSMDQDITILVTHHGGSDETDDAEPDDYAAEPVVETDDQTEKPRDDEEGASSNKECSPEEDKDDSVTKPLVPESPAPFGCHNIRTQVSLEVVQCQSVATSPMTPPEGDQAFSFPASLIGSVGNETKDVEYRSVGTAPMTPRTPTATVFPETIKEVPVEKELPKVEEEKPEEVEEDCSEKEEEPVQEVSWDEKGMTWEVYGAVVEVAVLGSAIQKHLEKQVKKQKGLPPPPPLNPSATPLVPEPAKGCLGFGKGRAGKRAARDGKGNRRRKNPFRGLMENMQQPHCCSRAHSTE